MVPSPGHRPGAPLVLDLVSGGEHFTDSLSRLGPQFRSLRSECRQRPLDSPAEFGVPVSLHDPDLRVPGRTPTPPGHPTVSARSWPPQPGVLRGPWASGEAPGPPPSSHSPGKTPCPTRRTSSSISHGAVSAQDPREPGLSCPSVRRWECVSVAGQDPGHMSRTEHPLGRSGPHSLAEGTGRPWVYFQKTPAGGPRN